MGKQLLDGTRGTFFWMDPSELTIIGLDTKDGEEHAEWDPRIHLPLKESLVRSVRKVGVRETVEVSVRSDGKGGQIAVVVDGKQRTRAAREATKRNKTDGMSDATAMVRVPVKAEKNMDKDLIEMLRIHLNEQSVESPPLMKAAEAHRLLSTGHPVAEVAEAFGVKTQTVSAWVKVHKSAPKVHKAVESGAISMTQAENIAAGQDFEAQEKLLDEVLAEAATNGGRSMPTSKIKARKKQKKTGNGNIAPKRRTLRRLVENEEAVKELPDGVVLGIRIAIGDLNPNSVKGLAGFLHEASVRKTGPS